MTGHALLKRYWCCCNESGHRLCLPNEMDDPSSHSFIHPFIYSVCRIRFFLLPYCIIQDQRHSLTVCSSFVIIQVCLTCNLSHLIWLVWIAFCVFPLSSSVRSGPGLSVVSPTPSVTFSLPFRHWGPVFPSAQPTHPKSVPGLAWPSGSFCPGIGTLPPSLQVGSGKCKFLIAAHHTICNPQGC